MKERKNCKTGILTYASKHRKTYDTLCLLKTKGYEDVNVYGVPFHYEKNFQPLFRHRPEMVMDYPDIEELCKAFHYHYFSCGPATEDGGVLDGIEEDRTLLLCGAGLLEQDFVRKHRIINAHPGYLPNCRGLDALKWAIVEGQPIGVTTHFLGEEVDAGEIIERRIVPVYYEDSFHALAQRVYETEIDMLTGSLEKMDGERLYVPGGVYEVHRRMPHKTELRLMEAFERLKNSGGG